MKPPKLENLGSLITYKDKNSKDTCLGYLVDFTGHGVFDAHYGKVDVSIEHAQSHNQALDEAMLNGLDENCKVGQGGTFYWKEKDDRIVVTTFRGTVVSEEAHKNGRAITFTRKGKVYRGREQHDAECFNFRRVR